MSLKIFNSPYELAEKCAEELVLKINIAGSLKKTFTVALSGGSTPELFFTILGDRFSKSVSWKHVHFFWIDERCVPPDNPDSNYGMTFKSLLQKIDVPVSNIHRIKGEDEPEAEALRYSDEISLFTERRDGLPLFDYILLGIGEDGHIASIFPGNLVLLNSGKICEVAVHPVSQQKRITITGHIINNADSVTFLITGSRKAYIVEKVLNKSEDSMNFPATYVVPLYGELYWLLDKDAAGLL
jgi:6-phosphogluconolactonase